MGEQTDGVPRGRAGVPHKRQHVDDQAQRGQQADRAQQGQQDGRLHHLAQRGHSGRQAGVQQVRPRLQPLAGRGAHHCLQGACCRSWLPRGGGGWGCLCRRRRRGSGRGLPCGSRLADCCELGQDLAQGLKVLALPVARACSNHKRRLGGQSWGLHWRTHSAVHIQALPW